MANICKFVPTGNPDETLSTINFVLETEYSRFGKERISSCYVFNIVVKGAGTFILRGKQFSVKRGDIFFIIPGESYSIIPGQSFACAYISYIGLRANKLMDKLGIKTDMPVFPGYEKYVKFYTDAFSLVGDSTVEILAEGLLLYGFSLIGKSCESRAEKAETDAFSDIKKYVDKNFSDSALSLESLCRKFRYNSKYISKLFKRKLNVGFKDYLTVLRIQHACALMKEGSVPVKTVAYQCGFSDPLYFSKVFKLKMLISPKEYCEYQHKSAEASRR